MSKLKVPRQKPGPSLKAADADPSPPTAALTVVRMAADDAGNAIERARAALWVLDQIECGELSFVNRTDSRSRRVASWWTSQVGDMKESDIHGWVSDMCVKTLGEALKEAAGWAHKAVETALVAEGKGSRKTDRRVQGTAEGAA